MLVRKSYFASEYKNPKFPVLGQCKSHKKNIIIVTNKTRASSNKLLEEAKSLVKSKQSSDYVNTFNEVIFQTTTFTLDKQLNGRI